MFLARQRIFRTQRCFRASLAWTMSTGGKLFGCVHVARANLIIFNKECSAVVIHCLFQLSKLFSHFLLAKLQEELLKFLSLARMLYWPQVHWLKILSIMTGSITKVTKCVCVFNCKLIFNWKFLITGLSWNDFDVIWDFNWGAWRRFITDSHLVVSRVLQISCRDELQWGTDIFWWSKNFVSNFTIKYKIS